MPRAVGFIQGGSMNRINFNFLGDGGRRRSLFGGVNRNRASVVKIDSGFHRA
jgi:hypothetical protein